MKERDEQKMVNENQEILEDDTIVYNYDDAVKLIDNLEKIKFSISDVILILLYSQHDKPIFGRLSLMKQVFFLIEEILDKTVVQDAKYVPFRYGMYSFIVGNDLINLIYSNYVEQIGRQNSKLEQFQITNKGIENIKILFDSLPSELQLLIKEKRKGWDQLGYNGILRLAYEKYPKFKEKSKIKNRYKSIKWGRGVG